MPHFEVHGYGRDTGRKRKRVYWGKDSNDVINRAAADSTIVESMTQIPDPLEVVSLKRDAFARQIDFPKDISRDALEEMMVAERQSRVDPLDMLNSLAAARRVAIIAYWPRHEDPAHYLVEPYEPTG